MIKTNSPKRSSKSKLPCLMTLVKWNFIYFFFQNASNVRKFCLCGKERTSPRKLWSAERARKKVKRWAPNFRVFSIGQCNLLEKAGKRPLIYSISSADENIQTDGSSLSPRGPERLQTLLHVFTQATTMQILFWPLVLWDQLEIILGKIKAKKLKKTGCAEVKKKAEISHRILTRGGSFPCFERTPELKLFVQADSNTWVAVVGGQYYSWLEAAGWAKGRPVADLRRCQRVWGVLCPSTGSVKVVRREDRVSHGYSAARKQTGAFDRTCIWVRVSVGTAYALHAGIFAAGSCRSSRTVANQKKMNVFRWLDLNVLILRSAWYTDHLVRLTQSGRNSQKPSRGRRGGQKAAWLSLQRHHRFVTHWLLFRGLRMNFLAGLGEEVMWQRRPTQRKALSPFECYPSETGREMRTAFLGLGEKCQRIFSIPPQTVAPVWLRAALLTLPPYIQIPSLLLRSMCSGCKQWS